MRDGYSNFSFFNALKSDVYSAATAGRDIDLQGYDTCTFVVNAFSLASAGAGSADNTWRLVIQAGKDDGTGTAVSTWSNVYHSQLIHSVIGINGAYSVLSDGCFQSLASSTDALSTLTYAVGYLPRPGYRWVRIYLSNTGVMSTMWCGAIAILGRPNTWPVNSPARA